MHDVLPIHPRTGLRAVGIVAGRPVWPIMGASPDDPSNANHPPEGGQGGQGGAPEGGGTGQPPAGGQGGAQPPAQQPPAQQPAEGQTFSAEYVKQLRDEAAGYRTQLRTVEGERDEARNALTPAQEQANARALELAVYRAAPGKGANPGALLDSVGFREAVAKLNPESDTFASSIEKAIEKAIETNPGLAAGPRRSGGADFAGGGNQSGRQPKGLSEAVTAHYTT